MINPKTKYNILILSIFILLCSGCARQQKLSFEQKVSFEMIEYGLMDYEIETVQANSSVAGGTINKLVNESIAERTDQIPAKPGTLFGFIYKINGENIGHKIKIKTVSLCPELRDPIQNKIFTKNEFVTSKKVGSTYSRAYMFNYEWELVPGEWVLQIWYEGKNMIEKRFNIYKP
jgi:Domain of unknown function (DUF3859)